MINIQQVENGINSLGVVEEDTRALIIPRFPLVITTWVPSTMICWRWKGVGFTQGTMSQRKEAVATTRACMQVWVT